MIKYFLVDFETTGLVSDEDYPIEIGGLYLNASWEIVHTIDTLILWPQVTNATYWENQHWNASVVHRISKLEYIEKAQIYTDVAKLVVEKCAGARPILMSDCIVFEWSFMQKLLKHANLDWPFHYCGWDTSLLFEVLKTREPIPPHRAFRDTCQTYKSLVESITKGMGLSKI